MTLTDLLLSREPPGVASAQAHVPVAIEPLHPLHQQHQHLTARLGHSVEEQDVVAELRHGREHLTQRLGHLAVALQL